MNHYSLILLIGICFLKAITFSNPVYAITQSTCSTIETSSSFKNAPLFRYKNGLVDVNFDKAPLGIILEQFKAEFNLQVKLYDPSIACTLVPIVLKERPLEAAIKEIMKRFSYVLYPHGKSFVVIVLSNDEFSTKTHGRITVEPESTMPPAYLSGSNAAQTPKSLDEFQPITMEGLPTDHTKMKLEDTDPYDQFKTEQKYQDALVQRANAAINSQYEHLRKEAISQLVGVNDPLATEILIDATKTETNSVSRVQAVEALRLHVENLQNIDITSIEALQHLAEDSDLKISKIAQEALLGIDKFKNEERSQYYDPLIMQ